MKNNNSYFLIAIAILLMLVQGHLFQKIGMLMDYFSNPDYEFFTTFSTADLLDLGLHGGIPIILLTVAIRQIRADRRSTET